MRHRRQWIVALSVSGLLVAVAALAAMIPVRHRMLADTGETRASAMGSLDRLLPDSAGSAQDAALLSAAGSLGAEPYVANVWLVDAAGSITYHSGGPGSVGRNVAELARPDAGGRIVDGLPAGTLDETTRLLILTMGAMRREGDHNDVFRHAVRPVPGPSGDLVAIVGITYDVNPAVSGPGGWWRFGILIALAGLGVYWLGLPLWTYLDARARGESSLLWASVVLITNLVGLLTYLIATGRPPAREI